MPQVDILGFLVQTYIICFFFITFCSFFSLYVVYLFSFLIIYILKFSYFFWTFFDTLIISSAQHFFIFGTYCLHFCTYFIFLIFTITLFYILFFFYTNFCLYVIFSFFSSICE